MIILCDFLNGITVMRNCITTGKTYVERSYHVIVLMWYDKPLKQRRVLKLKRMHNLGTKYQILLVYDLIRRNDFLSTISIMMCHDSPTEVFLNKIKC